MVRRCKNRWNIPGGRNHGHAHPHGHHSPANRGGPGLPRRPAAQPGRTGHHAERRGQGQRGRQRQPGGAAAGAAQRHQRRRHQRCPPAPPVRGSRHRPRQQPVKPADHPEGGEGRQRVAVRVHADPVAVAVGADIVLQHDQDQAADHGDARQRHQGRRELVIGEARQRNGQQSQAQIDDRPPQRGARVDAPEARRHCNRRVPGNGCQRGSRQRRGPPWRGYPDRPIRRVRYPRRRDAIWPTRERPRPPPRPRRRARPPGRSTAPAGRATPRTAGPARC